MAGATDDSPTDGSLSRSPRFRVALVVLALSYLLGWPVVALAAGVSPWLGVETAAMIGSGSYAVSWGLLGIAVLLGGREVMGYAERWWQTRRNPDT